MCVLQCEEGPALGVNFAAIGFLENFAKGALASLKTLVLDENKIGDDGLKALAEACRAKGALPALQTLFIDSPSAELTAYCASKSIKLNTIF